jgi:hypothetical protein
MIETFYHGGELDQPHGFGFWARYPSHAVNYSDGKSLYVVSLNLTDIVDDGIRFCDTENLDADESFRLQYGRIGALLAAGAEAVASDDGIAIPYASTLGAKKVSIDTAYKMYAEEQYIELVRCSVLHLPSTSVVAATNGVFPNMTTLEDRAVIGLEWMTLATDVQLEEYRDGSVRSRTIPAGSKIRLFERGNEYFPAQVSVIIPG